MQEGKEKQSGGLFFRRGTHMRGPPRTATGGAQVAQAATGPYFLCEKKVGKDSRGALAHGTPRVLFYVRPVPPFPRHGRLKLR